jgi:hypothetical protein
MQFLYAETIKHDRDNLKKIQLNGKESMHMDWRLNMVK